MFFNASSFTSDLSEWQTGKVENMSCMFAHALSFNSDLSKWETGRCPTNMHGMFMGTAALQRVPQWYTRWEEEESQRR